MAASGRNDEMQWIKEAVCRGRQRLDSVGRERAAGGLQSGCVLQQDETRRARCGESWVSL